jgi:hypothetical protein
MKPAFVKLMCCLLLGTSACTYNGIRMGERQRCGAMPQSEAERCYSRTSMTKSEYDAERKKLAASNSASGEVKKPVDPRYEEWLP